MIICKRMRSVSPCVCIFYWPQYLFCAGFDDALGVDLARDALDARALSGKIDFNARALAMPGWELDQAIRRTIEEKASSSGLLQGLLG